MFKYEISTKKQDKKSELRKKYVNTEKIIKMIRRELLSRPNCRRLQSQPNPNVQVFIRTSLMNKNVHEICIVKMLCAEQCWGWRCRC